MPRRLAQCPCSTPRCIRNQTPARLCCSVNRMRSSKGTIDGRAAVGQAVVYEAASVTHTCRHIPVGGLSVRRAARRGVFVLSRNYIYL